MIKDIEVWSLGFCKLQVESWVHVHYLGWSSSSIAYATFIRNIRGSFQRKLNYEHVLSSRASALLELQILYLIKACISHQSQLFDTNKIFTWHLLSEKVQWISDSAFITLGTVRVLNIGLIYLSALKMYDKEIFNFHVTPLELDSYLSWSNEIVVLKNENGIWKSSQERYVNTIDTLSLIKRLIQM